nr:hypothetical protein [Tanacetum cinerariifolium]
ETVRLFLAYASFKDFVVYQIDVNSAFLYGKIEEEHYMDFIKLLEHELKNASTPMKTQKPLLKDENGEEIDVHMYRSMIGSLMYLTSSRLDIMFAVCACTRYQHTLIVIMQEQAWIEDTTKTTQAMEIESLKRRVKKLEKRRRSRIHGLKRLYKVGLSTRVKSSEDEGLDQEKEDNVNITNNVNATGTNGVNLVAANTNNKLPFDPEMPALEDISTFNFSSDQEVVDEEADMNNMDITIQVSPTPTTRIHKNHPLDQVSRDLHSTTLTRNMSKNLEKHRFVTTIHQRTNYKDL